MWLPGVRDILHIDGVMCGSNLREVEGGAGFADVIEEPPLGRLVKKHVGRPRWEDLELRVDLSLTDRVYKLDHRLLAGGVSGEDRPSDHGRF